MTPDFDVIVVGSGPAGVSAAFPLVEAGLRILMVDGGEQPNSLPPSKDYLTSRTNDSDQWKWMVGENFHAIKNQGALSPKLRIPTHANIFKDYEIKNQITSSDFVAIGSMAVGGLSNAWGCGISRLSDEELKEFPLLRSDIDPSYETVSKRIGISGRCDDDMVGFFGVDDWAQPPIPMDTLHQSLFDRYDKRKNACSKLGFRAGRSRVAILSEDLGDRKPCDRLGNCMWGCQRESQYSAANELPALQLHGNFHHKPGFVVQDIAPEGSDWSVTCQDDSSSSGFRRFTAKKVFLAAGTLASTRLALNVLKLTKPVRLLSCPMAAFMLWLPQMLGIDRSAAYGLGQLSYSMQISENVSGFGATCGTTGIPVSEFVGHLPFGRRYGIDLLSGLLSSCLVGNLFLPGDLSNTELTLMPDGSLKIIGAYAPEVETLMSVAAKKLKRAYWQLGAILLPMSFTVGSPGGDIHYAGTLPMRKNPDMGETTVFGEVFGFNGLHVVDGASLSGLSGKSHTLTIMANADRIGRRIVESFKSENLMSDVLH